MFKEGQPSAESLEVEIQKPRNHEQMVGPVQPGKEDNLSAAAEKTTARWKKQQLGGPAQLEGADGVRLYERVDEGTFAERLKLAQERCTMSLKGLQLFELLDDPKERLEAATSCFENFMAMVGRVDKVFGHAGDTEQMLDNPEFYASFKQLVEGVKNAKLLGFLGKWVKSKALTMGGDEYDSFMKDLNNGDAAIKKAEIYLASSTLTESK